MGLGTSLNRRFIHISYEPYTHSLKVNFQCIYNIHEIQVHSVEFSTCDITLALKKF